VEGLLRGGRVTVAGAVAEPSTRVRAGDEVLLDGSPVQAPADAAVLLHKPAGASIALVHPPPLHAVRQLKRRESGVELLLADEALARRVGDPRFPQPEIWEGHMRTRYAGLDVGELAPGEWRPLARRELERLRRNVRLPPRT
jgi:16S rRNA U516 pseudouridylate synthase RsuA-like enzyme